MAESDSDSSHGKGHHKRAKHKKSKHKKKKDKQKHKSYDSSSERYRSGDYARDEHDNRPGNTFVQGQSSNDFNDKARTSKYIEQSRDEVYPYESSMSSKEMLNRTKEASSFPPRGKDYRSQKCKLDEGGEARLSSDYEFEWESFKFHLDRVFFFEDNFIRRGSQEHFDFWNFVKKYIAFQRKKAKQGTSKTSTAQSQTVADNSEGLNIPATYDISYRLNFSLLLTRDPTAIADMQGKRAGRELTEARLDQFEHIIVRYMDFVQKQKFSKLRKIKHDQENLPIFKYRERIIEAIREHQVVIVAGDTGCGKSTQVPQYLLAAGFEQIACTQPRRIACMSLARRVSHETLNEYGSEVAYQVRFEKSRTRSTKILFLTEGLLLRQMGTDPLLSQYSVIVIDEVHERHIHTDFLLGVLKCLLKQRSDLKLVLMSATINLELFSSYFSEAPVISVPGRLYPITLQYIPVSIEEQGSKLERLDPSPFLRVMQLIDHKYAANERGDVLMFLSGMSEIMSVVEAARQYAEKNRRWIVMPLHSALSMQEQDKVFDYPPPGVRKCIVGTNIAETSVTIDGIRFVVDSGKVKEMSYDTKYKMQRLQEFWISRASAEQRKGRAGRTGPGHCFRLYSESDFDALEPYSTPEIQRVPLDSLVLQMMSMGLANPRVFPFIEPPDPITIENAIAYLRDQSALNEEEVLTPIGKMLSQLPVDVVIGKMLIMASLFDMVDPVLNVCAALSVQSPFTQKAHRDYDAMTSRKSLESEHGDPVTLLNAFDEWLQLKAEGRDSRKWCRRRGLEEQRFYEMNKLKTQFKTLLMDHGLIDKEDKYSEVKTHEERLQLSKDRKRLRQLRHEQSTQSKKRRVLKMDDEDWEVLGGDGSDGETEEGDIGSNIKDLEFRLTNDLSKIQNEDNRVHSLTLRQINILKIILCSGLYPQVAIADEHNGFKSGTEQAFHTRNKGFVLLHPTSVYSTQPEALEVKTTKEDVKADPLKGPISNQHILLAFVSLLETQKPYLMGSMKVPALQTLLLFASQLDTSAESTRILCDGWLEVHMQMPPEEAEDLLSSVVKLRDTWKHLVEMKLLAHEKRKSLEDKLAEQKLLSSVRRYQRFVSSKLAEFLQCDVHYTLRRVLPAETARMYRGNVDEAMKEDSVLKDIMQAGAQCHPTKGGLQVNAYLVIGCLVEKEDSGMGEYSAYMQRHWTCGKCGETLVVTVAERLQHEQQCQLKHQQADDAEAEEKERRAKIPTRQYHCDLCDTDYDFTTAEILKHRKTCGKTEPDNG